MVYGTMSAFCTLCQMTGESGDFSSCILLPHFVGSRFSSPISFIYLIPSPLSVHLHLSPKPFLLSSSQISLHRYHSLFSSTLPFSSDTWIPSPLSLNLLFHLILPSSRVSFLPYRTLRVWDMVDGKLQHTVAPPTLRECTVRALAQSDRHLFAGSSGATVSGVLLLLLLLL